MPKTYVPGMMIDIHQLAMYLARYDSQIRAAITLIDPDMLTTYAAAKAAVLALDELRNMLIPLGE